jgi:hypothetical protein
LAVAGIESRAKHQQFVQRQPKRVNVGPLVASALEAFRGQAAPLAVKVIMTIPQPTAFSAPIHGHDGECPCCRRPFADVG